MNDNQNSAQRLSDIMDEHMPAMLAAAKKAESVAAFGSVIFMSQYLMLTMAALNMSEERVAEALDRIKRLYPQIVEGIQKVH